MNQSLKLFTVATLASALAACGGGGSGSSEPATGSVSMNITDAPATDFSNVTVAFTEIRLKPEDGEWISFPLEGFETINMLDLQEGVSEPLITNKEVLAGRYTGLRLIVDEDVRKSYVKFESTGDTEYTLAVPSGQQSGLKLQGNFIVAADTSTSFTVDFDVSKAIVDPQGAGAPADYFLRPALRLVDNSKVGSIVGEVDYALINSTRSADDGGENTLANCDYEGSIYVYSGADVEPTELNVNDPDNGPLSRVPVASEGESSPYPYTVAFLTEGTYTVSYSCQTDNNELDDGIEFDGTHNVTIDLDEAQPEEAKTIPLVE